MRITNNMSYRALVGAMQDRTQEQFDTQRAITTGLKFRQASDNPVAAGTIFRSEDLQAKLATQQKSLDVVERTTTHAESRLGDMADVLQSARELLLRGQSAPLGTEDGDVLASNLRSLADQVASIGNTIGSNGRPLFSGTGSSLPFAGQSGNWSLDPSMTAPIAVEVAPGRTLPAGVDATAAFRDSSGTMDIASLLESYADLVESTPTGAGGNQARADAIAAGLDEMDAVLERVTFARAEAGLALERVDDIRASHENQSVLLDESLAKLRDADLAEEITRLANENASLEAARAVFQKLEQQSLFNFL